MSFCKISRYTIAALIILLGISTAFGDKTNAVKENRAKARHFYLKGSVSESEGKFDEAYEYYKKAYNIDPSYADAGYAFGMSRVLLRDDTFTTNVEIKKSMCFMRALLDENPRDVNIHETYALYAVQADTLPEALRIYRNLVRQHPGNSQLYVPMSYIYMKMNHTDSAVQAIREFERLEGMSTETVMRKISYHMAKEDTVSALAEIREYVSSNPATSEVMLNEAMVYNVLGLQDSALLILSDAAIRFPENGELKYDMGLLYLEKGDTAKYHQLVLEALQAEDIEDEDRMEIIKQYLDGIYKGGFDFKDTDKVFAYMTKNTGNDIEYLTTLAAYNAYKQDYKEAYSRIKQAYAIDPADEQLLGRLMTFSILADLPQEGMSYFEGYEKKAESVPSDIMLVYISTAEVAQEYEKALAWTDSLLLTYSPNFSLADTVRQPSLADLSPFELNMASAVFEIGGDIYSRLNNSEGVLRSYSNALTLNADNASALNNYAYYLVETEKVAPGSPEFEKAKEMSFKSLAYTQDEPQSTYYDTYAWILFKEHNYPEAIRYQEMALELAGDSPAAEMLSHYGDMLFMTGKPEQAVEQWEKAFQLDPADKLLKKKIDHKTFFYE